MTTGTDLILYLSQFVSEHRLEMIDKVLGNRTRYLTVVLENIYQPQNASAVMRTCECLGIQDIHIIENSNKYTYNPGVAMGAGKWTRLIKYHQEENNTLSAIRQLKMQNYRIVATVPHENGVSLENFDITKGKTAIVIGSELHGLSSDMLGQADEFLTIPMFGFTESFNLSVSSAIILYRMIHMLRQSDVSWQLSGKEINNLKLAWLKASVKRSDLLVKKFRQSGSQHSSSME